MDCENGLELSPEDEAKLERFPTIVNHIIKFADNMVPKRTDEVLELMRNLMVNDYLSNTSCLCFCT